MTDERLGRATGQWLKDKATPQPNPHVTKQQAMAEVRRTKQIRHHWWLPTWRRKAVPAHDIDQTTDYQPSSIPGSNGHNPTVTGRTHSMFSPVKAVTAGALVFALGANEGCSDTDYEGPFEDSEADSALYRCSTEAGSRWWSFNDPRLEGIVTRINEEVTFEVGDVPDVYIVSTAFSIENDGGTWREQPRTWLLPDGISTFDWLPQEVLVLEGSGDYEGLVAVLRVTGSEAPAVEDFRGFIDDARWMPPPPENALTE